MTLIALDVPSITMSNGFTGEIPTHNDDLRNEIILNAIVEHFLNSRKCLRMI